MVSELRFALATLRLRRMNLKIVRELNTEQFLEEAFDPGCQERLIRAAKLRRNVYLVLFLVGFSCVIIAGLLGRTLLSILALFLATVSLVVMSKYETQVYFLKLIRDRAKSPAAVPED